MFGRCFHLDNLHGFLHFNKAESWDFHGGFPEKGPKISNQSVFKPTVVCWNMQVSNFCCIWCNYKDIHVLWWCNTIKINKPSQKAACQHVLILHCYTIQVAKKITQIYVQGSKRLRAAQAVAEPKMTAGSHDDMDSWCLRSGRRISW